MEIARQLTLQEYRMYHCIQPKECLDQNWNKSSKYQKSPNIMAMIEQFNKQSQWVITEILNEEQIEKRSKSISTFIQIAEKCKELQNFNATMIFIAALESTSVYRIKKTWQLILPEMIKKMEDLKILMAPAGNYKKLRSFLRSSTAPCLPYIGIFLADFVFIEEGNSDTIRGLINFSKRKQIANVIREIQQYQQTPYYFEEVSDVQKWLTDQNVLEENELYKLSLVVSIIYPFFFSFHSQREPRAKQ